MSQAPFLLFKRAQYWYYRLPGEKTFHSTGQTSKIAAQAFCGEQLREPLGKRRVTVDTFSQDFFNQDSEWVRSQKDAGHAFAPYQSLIRNGHVQNHIKPKFGKRNIDSVEAYEIRQWLQSLDLANGTKNSIISTLNILFTEARFRKYIRENPMQDVKRFAKRYVARDAFTIEDIKVLFPPELPDLLAIWKYAKWVTLYYTMLTTGMRRGEAAALLWKHIVWKKKGLLILQAVKAEKVIGLPKNGDQRAVILPQRTIDLLTWWRAKTLFCDDDHYVFHGEWGDKFLFPDTITKNFEKGLKQASKFDKAGRNLTVHSLRHTYNTRMERVLPAEILRYMVGHKTPEMTARYVHVTPEERLAELTKKAKKVEKVWR